MNECEDNAASPPLFLPWFVPQMLWQWTGYHARGLLDLVWRPEYLRRNGHLKDMHRGERLFILGSGPSIANHDLTVLGHEWVMTQNNFHVHQHIAQISPDFHVVVPMFQPKSCDNDWKQWFAQMNKRMPDDTLYFFGENSRTTLEPLDLFPGRRYYIRAWRNSLFARSAFVDLRRAVFTVPTATTMCLTVALYLGFSEIFLVGFDHDQICQAAVADVQSANYRFYDQSLIADNRAEKVSVHESFLNGNVYYSHWLTLRQLQILNMYARNHGQRIVNLSRGGLLFNFPRDSYEKVLSRPPQAERPPRSSAGGRLK